MEVILDVPQMLLSGCRFHSHWRAKKSWKSQISSLELFSLFHKYGESIMCCLSRLLCFWSLKRHRGLLECGGSPVREQCLLCKTPSSPGAWHVTQTTAGCVSNRPRAQRGGEERETRQSWSGVKMKSSRGCLRGGNSELMPLNFIMVREGNQEQVSIKNQ